LQIDTEVFVNQPFWDQQAGSLLLTVQMGQVLSKHTITSFTLPLRNSAQISIGVQPSIAANEDGVWKPGLRDTTVFTDGYTEILPRPMLVQSHNDTFRAFVLRTFLQGIEVQTQTCNVDRVKPSSRTSEAPWVDNSRYLCRVPNQQDCFDALQSQGCLAFCCFPCSIMGSVVEPQFLVSSITPSSLVLGALSTITVSIVASAPVGAPSELRLTGMLGSGALALVPAQDSDASVVASNVSYADDSVFIALSGPGAEVFSSSNGLWSARLGLLRLGFVRSRTLSSNTLAPTGEALC